MAFNRYLFAAVFVVVYTTYVFTLEVRDLECRQTGGVCVYEDDCPNAIETRGLCAGEGIECCHGISKSIITCEGNGGQCQPISARCGAVRQSVIDCPENTKCCPLV